MKAISSGALLNKASGAPPFSRAAARKGKTENIRTMEDDMGVLTRIIRLWNADLHGVMDQLEDKSLLIKQCMREMEHQLQQKKARLEAVRQSCAQIRQELAAAGERQARTAQDLALALRKEKDDIARALIRKRLARQAELSHLDGRLRNLENEEQTAARIISQQEAHYERLKLKAAAYCRQAEQRAETQMAPWCEGALAPDLPTEQEVELELLRSKETLVKGGEL